jgi:hypothetical protein
MVYNKRELNTNTKIPSAIFSPTILHTVDKLLYMNIYKMLHFNLKRQSNFDYVANVKKLGE